MCVDARHEAIESPTRDRDGVGVGAREGYGVGGELAVKREEYACPCLCAGVEDLDADIDADAEDGFTGRRGALYLLFGVVFSWSGRGRESGEDAGVRRNRFGFAADADVMLVAGTRTGPCKKRKDRCQ
jgi:hypothetical protein